MNRNIIELRRSLFILHQLDSFLRVIIFMVIHMNIISYTWINR